MIPISSKHKGMTPEPMPSETELAAAFKVVDAQWLHVYQLLYFRGLTQPGDNARPFSVKRSSTASHCIDITMTDQPELKFFVRGTGSHDTDEAILEKVELLLKARGKAKIDPRACCALAEQKFCVCRFSYTCPVHGSQCIGSHD